MRKPTGKLVDRSAFGEIYKFPGQSGVADVYRVVASGERVIKFKNTQGTLITGKEIFLTSMFDARRLIGKTQTGAKGLDEKITIASSNVVSDMGILDKIGAR